MNTTVRLHGHARPFGILLALIMMMSLAAMPASAAPAQQTEKFALGAVSTMAIDNVGGGWGWAGPDPLVNSIGTHLIRLQDGKWHDVPKTDPAWGALKDAAAVYKMVLAGDGKTGWAIGSGGGQHIWQFKNGTWQLAAFPFESTVVLMDLTINADASDGWIVAQDQSVRFVVARLHNGRWTRDLQPVSGEMRNISLSPSGKAGWGIGPSRNDPTKFVAVRLENGKWVDDSAQVFTVPFNSIAVTADDSGNGWVIGPPINSVLVRLTKKGALQVLPDERQDKPSLYPSIVFQAIAVNAVGRGWATATYKTTPGPRNGAPVNQPLLFRLDGDTFTPSDLANIMIPTPQDAVPDYAGPLAITPDGAHSWLAESADISYLGLEELHEPWEHTSPAAAQPLQGAGICFDQVKYCLRGVFATYWHERGGLYNMGYPITPEVKETINGTEYVVQYTQRARMEYHPENKGTPYEVLLGLLGNTLSDPRQNEPPFRPAPAPAIPIAGTQWFAPTQHNIGPPFFDYWTQNGGLPIFGYPRSEAFNEQNQADSNTYLVQYFERNRIEYHPENHDSVFQFLLGLLGVEQFKATYGYTP